MENKKKNPSLTIQITCVNAVRNTYILGLYGVISKLWLKSQII
jgi:hypothetical protein